MSAVATLAPGFRPIPTTAISGAGTTTGSWCSIRTMRNVSFQAVWDGTLAGTFSFEITNEKPSETGSVPASTATATALTLPAAFSSGNPAGSPGSFDFRFRDMSELWIRPKFTYSAGSGNLTVIAFGKSV